MNVPTLVDLALWIARRPASGLELPGLLTETSERLAFALGVPAAVIVLSHPGASFGSDRTSVLIGDIQQRDGGGPLLTAIRTGRPMGQRGVLARQQTQGLGKVDLSVM